MSGQKEADEALNDLAREFAPMVAKIEAGLETTQDHYGRYMAILGVFEHEQSRRIAAVALVRAGANRRGVGSAFEALT